MKISASDQSNPITLTGTARSVFIEEITDSQINVVVGTSSQDAYPLVLTPDILGRVELDMKSISSSIVRPLIPLVVSYKAYAKTNAATRIQITATSASDPQLTATIAYVKGDIYPPAKWRELISTRWWTWRSQSQYKVFPEGTEQLTSLFRLNVYAQGVRIHVKAYLKNGGTASATICDITPTGAAGEFFETFFISVNCSLPTMKKALGNPAEDIVAYDIYGVRTNYGGEVVQDRFPAPQRFIVGRSASRPECLIFRNTLGAFDTLYATGSPVRKIDSERQTFINRNIEGDRKVRSTPKLTLKSYSGGARTAELWQDFVASEERYHVVDGNPKRIVLDEYSVDSEDGVATPVSVTFHYAERTSGRYQPLEYLNNYK